MNTKRQSLFMLDCFYIVMMILPILAGVVIKVLTTPVSDGIAVAGALIYLRIPMPLQELPITESQVNSWLVMISIIGLSLFLTNGMRTRNITKRQMITEWIVEKADKLVSDSMGDFFIGFAPFIISIIALSAFSSLLSLFGIYPPTSDVNVVGGWAMLVFGIITYYKCKCGPMQYIKSFTEPVAILTPMNLISEIATPISMAFRHYGNVLSGLVISVLIGYALKNLSGLVLGWMPGFLGDIPLFQVGLPAVLSIYFDLFSGCLQAYIFAMLTMMYVSGGFPAELYFECQKKKENKIKKEKTEVM